MPATLALALKGGSTVLGPFVPGLAAEYQAQVDANVISTAADATLSVADASAVSPGKLVNGAFSLPQPLLAQAGTVSAPAGAFAALSGTPLTLTTWSSPVSNDTATIAFKQAIGATDALRTGVYAKTLTFTLSTTTPCRRNPCRTSDPWSSWSSWSSPCSCSAPKRLPAAGRSLGQGDPQFRQSITGGTTNHTEEKA